MAGEPSYIEIGTPDPKLAMAFYGSLFGWSFTPMPGGGQATTGGLDIGFHGGDPAAIHEVFYLVDDLEGSIETVRGLGGTTLGEIVDSGPFGRWIECADDQGARFGIRQKP